MLCTTCLLTPASQGRNPWPFYIYDIYNPFVLSDYLYWTLSKYVPKYRIWTLLHLVYIVVIPARNFLEITPNSEASRSSPLCYSGDLDVPSLFTDTSRPTVGPIRWVPVALYSWEVQLERELADTSVECRASPQLSIYALIAPPSSLCRRHHHHHHITTTATTAFRHMPLS